MLGLTPNEETARRLAVVWGVHALVVPEVHTMTNAVSRATRVAHAEGFAERAQLSALLLAKLAEGSIDGPAIRQKLAAERS